MMDKPEQAVIEGVKQYTLAGAAELTLASGVRVRVKPIASGLMEHVLTRIPDPPVPKQTLENGRVEENPFDPSYLQAMADAGRQRSKATIDVIVMMCFELVDGVPEDALWLPKLRMLESMGHVDLSGFDLKDDLVREFVFKRHIAVSSEDVSMAMDTDRIRQEVVAQAAKSFPGP
jgi:hypothetical protein